ncbi:MAG: cyclic pyranopterin monophosphate synthase MoaC [Thermodesulfovibrionales bacterium]
MKKLSHIDEEGKAVMVDVSKKKETRREAVASATVKMKPETLKLIMDKEVPKGDVFSAARIAGIMAAKKTPTLIPLCHPLNIEAVEVDFKTDEKRSEVRILTKAKITGRTGVEMESLTAATVAALTIYDMCKAVDKGIIITDIMLLQKKGGKSGRYKRKI